MPKFESKIREFNAFRRYDRVGRGRRIRRGWRGIEERLVAHERGREFYDGDRRFGYGGYSDKGLWKDVAADLISTYDMREGSSILQIGCDYGFLLRDLQQLLPGAKVLGLEPSRFAAGQVEDGVRPHVIHWTGPSLPLPDDTFDLIICAGMVYTFDLAGAKELLSEIVRVGRDCRYVALGTYEDSASLEAFKEWSLLGQTILSKDDWLQLLAMVHYEGDVSFVSASSLGIVLENGREPR